MEKKDIMLSKLWRLPMFFFIFQLNTYFPFTSLFKACFLFLPTISSIFSILWPSRFRHITYDSRWGLFWTILQLTESITKFLVNFVGWTCLWLGHGIIDFFHSIVVQNILFSLIFYKVGSKIFQLRLLRFLHFIPTIEKAITLGSGTCHLDQPRLIFEAFQVL